MEINQTINVTYPNKYYNHLHNQFFIIFMDMKKIGISNQHYNYCIHVEQMKPLAHKKAFIKTFLTRRFIHHMFIK